MMSQQVHLYSSLPPRIVRGGFLFFAAIDIFASYRARNVGFWMFWAVFPGSDESRFTCVVPRVRNKRAAENGGS